MRISRQLMFMNIARTVSMRSTCPRLNVGAIITYDNNIVSMGYNGSPPDEPHCYDAGCLIGDKGGCVRTLHAEENAIRRLKSSFNYGLHLYVTHSPCKKCAQLIAESGISKVYYEVPYRDDEPLNTLLNQRIEVYQCTPSGFIIRKGSIHEG